MSTREHNQRVIARESHLDPPEYDDRSDPTEGMSIGDMIDWRYRLKDKIAKLNSELKGIKETADMLDHSILGELGELDLAGAKGSTAQVAIVKDDIPIVEDFDKLLTWMEEDLENRFIFQRRLATRTVKEMRDEGSNPPGVGTLQQTKLSLRKL